MDKLLHRVRALIERGERISAADCRALFDVSDLNEFSKLSRIVRERRYGKDAFYRSVELFEYRGEHPELFMSEIETISPNIAAELAIKPIWKEGTNLDKWLERFRSFAAASVGERSIVLNVSGRFIAKIGEAEGSRAGDVLTAIREVIPIRLSGVGAELFDDGWRAEYAPDAISSERWLAVHQAAHEIGLKTESGMTYHTGWNADLYASHMETIRSLQDQTAGFHSFAPMAFHDTHPHARYLAIPSTATTLKVTAIARLFFDNIPHIITSPAMSDPETSYVALSYGADTVDPTIRPSDLESRKEYSSDLSGGGLPVLSEGEGNKESRENKLALSHIQERIVEARWKPIPVDGDFERIAMEEISR